MRGGALIIGAMFALAIAGGFITGSGFADHYGLGDPVGPVDERVEQQANDSALQNGSISGESAPDSGSSIISAIVNGATRMASILSLALVLPFGLIQIGFPPWFALSLGSVVYIIGGISLVQFITGRTLR